VVRIDRLNSLGTGALYAVNKFSDLSPAEFKQQYLGYTPRTLRNNKAASVVSSPPTDETSVDWRTKGAVTPVKDQEQCGSCWAFSTAEEVESQWFMTTKKLLTLSPQQIVSCDTVDQGCNGGDTVTAYQYVQDAGGLESEADYPYTSGGGDSGTCSADKSKNIAQISGFSYATDPCTDSCTSQNETKLADALAAHGPVSICVYAETWQDYTSGILSSDCPSDYSGLDHCVQLVGYDKSSDSPYWLVRNSWNTNWGEEGYIRLAIGSNLCGVADEATIAKAAPTTVRDVEDSMAVAMSA